MAYPSTVTPLPLPHAHGDAEHCPLCEQPVPHEARDRIRTREAERQQAVAARMQAQFARERAEQEARAKADLEALRRQMQDREAAAESALESVRRAHAESEVRIRAEAAQAADLDARERILAAETARQAAELALRDKLDEQREQLEKAHVRLVNEEKARAYEEKLKLEEKLQDVQRQLQRKSNDELGDGAEIDLFEQLSAEFTEDKISRVAKGEAGADTIHDIYHNGRLCGRIVYESKNSGRWLNEYVSKLRQDQLKANADHAILSTHKLPADARQVHVQDTVVVCQPARVLAMAQILRRHVVQLHLLKLSNEERSHKTEALYDFIISARCGQYLDDIKAQAAALEEIDAKERKAHESVWKRRSDVIRKTQRVHGDLTAEIERIIGTGGDVEIVMEPVSGSDPAHGSDA
jgi:hypothetical protein